MIVETTEELNDKTISLLRAEQPKRYNALTKPELDRKWTEIDLETFLGEQIYSECKTLEITANPRTPKENNTINSLMAALWVMAHPKEFTPLARLFIKNIEHITFSQFKQQLYKSVMAFNQKLMQLPEGQRDYFIFLPPGDKKSNSWVLSLALPYLAIPPVAIKKIGGGTTNKDTLTGLFSNHNHVEIGLYIDDACYSGSQANGMLDSVNQYKNANFKTYLCIPYLGKIPQLENKISDGSVLLLPHHRMLSFLQKLAPLETGMTEEELNKKIPGSSLSLSQTYFDHKVADFVSIPPVMATETQALGKLLHQENEWNTIMKFNFMPNITPPYKKDEPISSWLLFMFNNINRVEVYGASMVIGIALLALTSGVGLVEAGAAMTTIGVVGLTCRFFTPSIDVQTPVPDNAHQPVLVL